MKTKFIPRLYTDNEIFDVIASENASRKTEQNTKAKQVKERETPTVNRKYSSSVEN